MFNFDKLKMQPRSSKYKPPATDEQIAELEEYCGHTLPENYKTILRNYNWALPGAILFTSVDEETGVPLEYELSIFYYLDGEKGSPENIWYIIKRFSAFIGPNTIPFADDGIKQVYYLKWKNNVPQVWYLSYLDLDEPETHLVKDSFDELLEELYAPN